MKNNQLTATISKVLESYPIAFAYLVGSQAAGTTRPMSDVDVAAYFGRPKDKLTGLASELSVSLQAALGRQDVDVIELNRAGIPVLSSIMKNAVPLVINNVDEEKDFKRSVYKRIVDFQPTLNLIGRRTLQNIRKGGIKS